MTKTGEILARGISSMGLTVPGPKQQALLDYLDLLHKWNKAYNLSGVRDINAMVSRHLLDSLSLLPFMDQAWQQGISRNAVLDIGTGPGLPGIPLALCYPDREFVLLDSNGKKTRFLFHVQLALGLDNIHIVNERIEDCSPEQEIDTITSRAFSTLLQMLQSSDHVNARHVLAMKGEYPTQELGEVLLHTDWQLQRAVKVNIPGSDASRHIIELVRQQQRKNNNAESTSGE